VIAPVERELRRRFLLQDDDMFDCSVPFATLRAAAGATPARPARRFGGGRIAAWAGRLAVVGVLIGAVIVAGVGRSHRAASPPAHKRASADTRPPIVVLPVETVPAGTVIRGATPLEAQETRAALRLLGPGSPIATVTFDNHGGGLGDARPAHRREVVATTQSRFDPIGDWLAQALTRAVAARLRGDGHPVMSSESLPPSWHPSSVRETVAAAQMALARARQAGFAAYATVYPIGVYSVTIRLTDQQYFSGTPAWDDPLWPEPADHARGLLIAEAPDGTPFDFGGRAFCFDCITTSEPTPGTPLPRALAGPTRLTVTIAPKGYPAVLKGEPAAGKAYTIRIDCSAGAAAVVLATCDDIIRDRYRLFVPLRRHPDCPGGIATIERATIRGNLGAIAVDRAYNDCYEPAIAAWIAVTARLK
jgi:hypothetical protein